MICRLIMGVGMDIKISTIPVYSAEVSPASIRGAIVTSFQLYVTFGILVGFSSNLIFMNIGRLAWRFQLAAAFVPAVPLMVLIWLCPESPGWLMKKERYQQAYRALNRIRNTELLSARELFYAHCQIVAESEIFGGKSLGRRFLELFAVPRIRRATVSSSIIVTAQQFSGKSGIEISCDLLSVSHSPLSWPRSRRQVHSVCMPASTYCHSWSSSSWYRRPSREHLRTLMSSSVSRQLDMHHTRVRSGYRIGSSAISSCRRLRLWGGS
jgi:hypothetical protein